MVVYIARLEKINDVEIEKSVARGLKKICNPEFLRGVKTVLIKPNFINSRTSETGITTDLRIIVALIKIFKMLKKEVIVGEGSIENTEKVFGDLRIYELEKLGTRVVNFEKDEKILVRSPAQLTLKEFYLPKSVIDADLIISVPKMKTHSECSVTLSIKNLFGMLTRKDRKIAHMQNIHESLIDLFSYLKKSKKLLCFVDAIIALEGKGGPIKGNPVNLGLIIAGNDLLATDIACVKIMNYLPNKVKHIEISMNLGLGKRQDIIIGENIDKVKRKFEMPLEIISKISFLKPITKKIFKKRPFLNYPDKCTLCKRCIEMCPQEAISLKRDKISFDYNRCIGCLVCCESCMQGALDYKVSNLGLYKIARKIKRKITK